MPKNSAYNEQHYSNKIFRLKPDYLKVFDFFSLMSKMDNVSVYDFIDDAFNYSLDQLSTHEKSFFVSPYKPLRTAKGIPFKPTTLEKFSEEFDSYSRYYLTSFSKKLLICEFAEMNLYVYCKDKLPKNDFKKLKIDWGIIEIF